MSTERRATTSRDGRFILRYRCKDSWGDFSNMEEDWRIEDMYGTRLGHWTGIQEDEETGVVHAELSPDQRSLLIRRRGHDEKVELPAPVDHGSDEDRLRAAIFAAPDEDAPRAVYADFLQERGDPRGELIALQISRPDDARVRQLLADHERRFRLKDRLPLEGAAVFERGFVCELTVPRAMPRTLELLVAQPAAACLHDLILYDAWMGDELARSVAGSNGWTRLTHLGFPKSMLTDVGVREIAASPHLGALRSLDVRENPAVTAEGLRALPPRITVRR